MTVLIRTIRRVLILALAPAVLTPRQLPAEEIDLLAELAAAAEEAGVDLDLPQWDVTAGIDVAAGHRTNVTLSPFSRDASGLVRAHVEVFAWKMPVDGFEWVNYFDATASRYFSAASDDSRLVIARSEPRWELRDGLQVLLGAQFIHQYEIIDASTLESGLGTALADLESLALEPAVRWTVAPGWELRFRAFAKYDDFKPPLDDYREWRGDIGATRDLGRAGSVSLVVGRLLRDYVERSQATIGGRPIPGTQLQVDQSTVDLRHEWIGGAEWKWDLTSKLSFSSSRDNGTGWYDYDRRGIVLGGGFRHAAWRVEVDAGWHRYDYRVQTAGFEDPPKRTRDSWTAFVRAERSLSEAFTVFVEADAEKSDSNDPFIVYDDVSVMFGLAWSL